MVKVEMPRADWDVVIFTMCLARDAGLVAYIDGIIDDIDDQVSEQEC